MASEAESYFLAALAIDRKYPPLFHNYGLFLAKNKRHKEAIEQFNQALKLFPNFAPVYCDRGIAQMELSLLNDSLASHDTAIKLAPNAPVAYYSRANTLVRRRDFGAALRDYDKAIALHPKYPDAYCGRGNVFYDLERFDEAILAYDKALAIKPDLENAWLGRGNVLFDLKRYDEAFAAYHKALAIKPDLERAEGARLRSKQHHCDWSNFESESAHLISSVQKGNVNSEPFVVLAIPSSGEDQLKCAKLMIAKKYPPHQAPLWKGGAYRHEKIRLAYVSADFRQHATAFLMAGMFECHDKSRFEITAISLGRDDKSDIRERLKRSFDRFINAETSSDEEIASYIKNQEIDILIDLKGFTKDARTNVFARRPAPIQLSYLGYPGTMGASYIDYLIADTTIIPDEFRWLYSEKVVVLPNTYQVNDQRARDLQ